MCLEEDDEDVVDIPKTENPERNDKMYVEIILNFYTNKKIFKSAFICFNSRVSNEFYFALGKVLFVHIFPFVHHNLLIKNSIINN